MLWCIKLHIYRFSCLHYLVILQTKCSCFSHLAFFVDLNKTYSILFYSNILHDTSLSLCYLAMMCHASINLYQFGIGCIKHKIGLKPFCPLAVSVYYVKNGVYFHTLYCKTFSFSTINYFLRPPPPLPLWLDRLWTFLGSNFMSRCTFLL